MPSGILNLKKLIAKKNIPRPIMNTSDFRPSLKIQKDRESLARDKKKKEKKVREEEIKIYKRSLDRWYMAFYLQRHEGIPYLEAAAGMEGKGDPQIKKLVLQHKEKLVKAKFGEDEESEWSEDEE